MEENIKLYFDKKPKTEVKHNWEPGHLCTIQYNDYYYRGKVYKVNGPDDITAVMIDFGSDHVLSEKSVSLFQTPIYNEFFHTFLRFS